jgi:hypothetical protein
MNDKDKQEFEKWFKDYWEVDFNAGNPRFVGQSIAWKHACEYMRNKSNPLTDKLTTQLVSYEATLGFLKDTLREIADEDYRGNRSNASVKAYQALKKIGAYKEEQI